MKKCPQCSREYDLTMSFCLDDGEELLYGPASGSVALDEPATAILHSTAAPGEAPTRAQIHTTEQTAVLPSGVADAPKRGFDKRLLVASIVLAVIVLGGFFGYRYLTPADSGQINSIAVLPFQNKSGDANSDYLSDGLAESLIYRLSQLPNLKVSPTSSVIRYKGKDTEVAKIASELGVDTVMTGRLAQIGDNLTISIELIDVRNNKLLWGEQYERRMSDLLVTQREIATEIVSKLKLKLSGEGEQKLAKKYTDNTEAYQLYLKGRFYFAKRTKEDLLQSIECYKQAIGLDPNFALAYVGAADSFSIMPSYGYASPKEAIPQSKAAAQRALEIDPLLSEAHTSLAYTLSNYDWNWAEAEREFKRAIELNPNVAYAHYQYGLTCLTPLGRFEEATVEMKRAVNLEPLTVAAGGNLAGVYIYARKYDLALEQARKTIALESSNPNARYWMAFAYAANGMYADTISACGATLSTDPDNQDCLQVVGYAYAKTGRRDEAEKVIRKFHEIGKTQYSKAYSPAVIYAILGDKDKAFAELEKAVEARDWDIAFIQVDPFIDSLRDDSRFADLVKRIGFPH